VGEGGDCLKGLRGGLERLARSISDLGLHSLVVFGSRARGDCLRDSDIDVLVVAEGFEGRPFYEREYLVLERYRGGLPVEPWCYTPKEVLGALEGRPRLDVLDALEYGVVIVDDGFWERARRLYNARRPRRTPYGGVALD